MMASGVKAKIYYIPGSHPCEAVFKAAELKGIEYKRSLVVPPMQPIAMTLLFGGRSVPAMKITDGPDGTEKVQGSRKIVRTFESLQPEPALFPSDPGDRERVVAAETWGDGVLQELVRRLTWAYLWRSRKDLGSFSVGHKIPLPKFAQNLAAPMAIKIEMRINNVNDESTQADLAALPDVLDQIDQYIADGLIGGDQPNAADLQIFSCLWLLRSMRDMRAIVDARPCGAAAEKLFGAPAGDVTGGVLPDAWYEPLRSAQLLPA